mmetsp:Transcript_7276/g.20011  ORF Transcript_7276/g.20011 Transcript_7276/m.20011 type:complete len:396 (+) Transcript_7276:99-1286(+)
MRHRRMSWRRRRPRTCGAAPFAPTTTPCSRRVASSARRARDRSTWPVTRLRWTPPRSSRASSATATPPTRRSRLNSRSSAPTYSPLRNAARCSGGGTIGRSWSVSRSSSRRTWRNPRRHTRGWARRRRAPPRRRSRRRVPNAQLCLRMSRRRLLASTRAAPRARRPCAGVGAREAAPWDRPYLRPHLRRKEPRVVRHPRLPLPPRRRRRRRRRLPLRLEGAVSTRWSWCAGRSGPTRKSRSCTRRRDTGRCSRRRRCVRCSRCSSRPLAPARPSLRRGRSPKGRTREKERPRPRRRKSFPMRRFRSSSRRPKPWTRTADSPPRSQSSSSCSSGRFEGAERRRRGATCSYAGFFPALAVWRLAVSSSGWAGSPSSVSTRARATRMGASPTRSTPSR